MSITIHGRYKIIVYHGSDIGELYDLHSDPSEFDNRWAASDYQSIKMQLLLANFEKSVATVDPIPASVGKF